MSAERNRYKSALQYILKVAHEAKAFPENHEEALAACEAMAFEALREDDDDCVMSA